MHFPYQYRRMFYSFSSTEGIAELLDVSQYNMWEMGSQGVFNLQFLIMSKAEYLSIFFRALVVLFSLSYLNFFFSFFYSTGTFGFRFNRVNGLPLSIVHITFFSVCHFPFFSGEFINLLMFSIILFINCVLIWTVSPFWIF